jgi:transcriptional regulator with XRE-family HTH domain
MPERHTTDPFLKALANLMKERGIDQLRLSGLARMNQSSVSRYLDGLRKPSLASMEKIAAALEVSPDFFLEYRIERVKAIMEARPEVVSGVYDRLTSR